MGKAIHQKWLERVREDNVAYTQDKAIELAISFLKQPVKRHPIHSTYLFGTGSYEVKRYDGKIVQLPYCKSLIESSGNSFSIKGLSIPIPGRLLQWFKAEDDILVMTEKDDSLILQNLQGYGLSSRETDVLKGLSQGKSNLVIAIILGMSKRTVDKHLEHIFVKLGVETRAAAASVMNQ